ncbi:hypothetical protein JJB71_13440 [Clostridium perfringens]|uniref:hypothetical protein n=1 Tax=Clostridium perfringens TaxID=1502 RepID=UPI001ABADB32|nr:hypothetical protein [Clostridium perfringens]MBO3398543.1 hypothetical protein [Clostridium perfringens]
MTLENLIGKRFGKLKVVKQSHSKNYRRYWECECDCGNKTIVTTSRLKNGHTKSCGCLSKEVTTKRNTKHGKRNTRIYEIWAGMKKRCLNKKSISYKNYGGRGVSICEEWKNSFEKFYNWAINNGYNENLTIDRIDVNGNYEPNNCRWCTKKEQSNNKRNNRYITINKETKTLSEWANYYKIKSKVVENRINRYKWSIEEALEIVPRKRKGITYTYNGVTKTLVEWSEFYNISRDKLYYRLIKNNWNPDRAFEI